MKSMTLLELERSNDPVAAIIPPLLFPSITVDDSKAQQVVSHYALAGEKHTQVYRPQHHGLARTLRPDQPASSFLSGRALAFVLVALSNDNTPNRLKEVRPVYDMSGNVIYLANKNGVTVDTEAGDTTIKTPMERLRCHRKETQD